VKTVQKIYNSLFKGHFYTLPDIVFVSMVKVKVEKMYTIMPKLTKFAKKKTPKKFRQGPGRICLHILLIDRALNVPYCADNSKPVRISIFFQT
jgi:hypothetical protein